MVVVLVSWFTVQKYKIMHLLPIISGIIAYLFITLAFVMRKKAKSGRATVAPARKERQVQEKRTTIINN